MADSSETTSEGDELKKGSNISLAGGGALLLAVLIMLDRQSTSGWKIQDEWIWFLLISAVGMALIGAVLRVIDGYMRQKRYNTLLDKCGCPDTEAELEVLKVVLTTPALPEDGREAMNVAPHFGNPSQPASSHELQGFVLLRRPRRRPPSN